MRITKKTIDGLVAGDRDQFIWDDEISGFGVKLTPKGKKVFIQQTRLNGQIRRYTIGPYGSPWTLDKARLEARKLLGQVAAGVDPMEEKRAGKKDLTVKELTAIYWEAVESHKKEATVSNEKGQTERHILPLLGRVRLRDLKKQHVQKFLSDIAAGKTAADVRTKKRGRAVVSGGKGAANRTLGLLSSMLSFAVEQKMIAENPALGIKHYKLKKHERYLSSEELERLGNALREFEEKGANLFAIAAIRFLVLSGCRRNEALGMQWAWIDFERSIVSLPDSKTGAKVVLLGKEALNFIKALPKVHGSPLVFPSAAGGETQLSIQKVWDRVRSAADLNGVRLHDLRHNFASIAVSSGQSLYIVGKLLGHSQSQTTQRYAHLAPDPVHEAANNVAGELAAKLAGKLFGSDTGSPSDDERTDGP